MSRLYVCTILNIGAHVVVNRYAVCPHNNDLENDEDGEEGPKNTYNEYFFRAIIIQICASITYYIGFIAIKWGESHLASWGVVVLSIMILLVFEEK